MTATQKRGRASRSRETVHAQLLASVAVDAKGCWLYTGFCFPSGYGLATFEGKPWRAHRLMWVLERGEIPDGLFVCHHCDTPPCIRIDHLFLGTAKENTRDMINKGRYVNPYAVRTHCNQGHPLTGANVYLRPGGGRACNTCRILRARAQQAALGMRPSPRHRKPLPIERFA